MDILDLLPLPASLPLRGVLWLADKIAEQAENQYYGEEAIRRALVELQLQLDLGEIDEDSYMTQEEQLLARLKIARDRNRAAIDEHGQ